MALIALVPWLGFYYQKLFIFVAVVEWVLSPIIECLVTTQICMPLLHSQDYSAMLVIIVVHRHLSWLKPKWSFQFSFLLYVKLNVLVYILCYKWEHGSFFLLVYY